jgi:NADPH-ferrihemoprotein reductase
MKGNASEILEELGKQYLDHLINNYENKPISSYKESNQKKPEEEKQLKTCNKKKVFIENNPCVNKDEDYYPELIPSFTILFATEMGTAEGFANDLHKEATEKLHLKAKILNVSEVNSVQLFNENSLIVIIASTWGEGEPTDDCVDFNKMLKSKEFWDGFTNGKNLNVAIFGLGNTAYTFYNAQAKLFKKILVEEHKLNEMCPMTLGNARRDIEQDFQDWKDNVFFKSLYSFYSKNYEENLEFYKKYNLLNELPKEVDNENVEVKKNYELFSSEKKELNQIDIKQYNQNVQNRLNSKKVKILNIQELRQNNINGSTLKVVLDLKGTDIKYQPAVNILVYPNNREEAINMVLNQLAMDKDNYFINYKILDNNKDTSLNLPFPEGITVKEALSEYIDLSCQINKNILAKIVIYLTDVNQKNKITEIINDEKKLEEFLSKRYNISDFIKEYDSLQLSLQDLSEIFPTITPRYYTCASSNNKKNNTIELIITLVSWKGPKNDQRFGLTSNYFNDLYKAKSYLEKDVMVNITLKESAFKLPSDLSTPILMMCTGSGIAPFVSFLEELEYNKKDDKKYETYLIFGSMNKKNDFIFEKELEEFKKKGVLTEYYTAFSRDQEKKVYVQDVLGKEFNKERLEELVIKKGMMIYICGSLSMGNAVTKKVGDILGEENKEKIMKNNQLMSEMWENK